MSKHKQSVIIFGVVLPSLFLVGLIALTLFGRGKLAAADSEKQAKFDSYNSVTTEVNQLETMLDQGNRRAKVAYWNSKLDRDFIQSLNENLNRILAKYDDSVLRQTAMSRANDASKLASGLGHPHTRINLKFAGGFKPMQLFMAELESEMPQLVLESVSVTPKKKTAEDTNHSLNFNLVYLSWEKPNE